MIENYRGLLGSLVKDHPVLEIAVVHHKNLRGEPISFQDMPYLVELYTDAAKLEDWVIRKCVQTGFSEWGIQFALQRAGWSNRIVAYVLPTYNTRGRFVQQRINPLLQGVPAYRERQSSSNKAFAHVAVNGVGKKNTDNLSLKKFNGGGSILFLGSNTDSDFVEFSCDLLVIDEYDECDGGNLAKARDRLRASPYAQMLRVGNPTLPRVGISRLYDESDGRRWFHQCQRCGYRQPLDWFLNVVQRADDGSWIPRDTQRYKFHKVGTEKVTRLNDIRPVCVRCHQPWDRVADGSLWVPERPEYKTTRGYTCSRMDVLYEPLVGLYREWNKVQGDPEALGTFHCSVLGVPYEFEGAKLSSGDLELCCTGDPVDWAGGEQYRNMTVVAGVDVGSVLHVTIDVITKVTDEGEPYRSARLVCTCRTFEEVGDILRRYFVSVCVIDSMPEIHKAQELRDEFLESGECSIWLCRFTNAPRAGQAKYGMKLDYASQTANVDRTALMDVAYQDIRQGRREFPEDAWSVLGWSEQMRAPVRVLDEEKSRIVWVEGNAADHYRLSDTYARLAYDLCQIGGSYVSV